MDRNKYNLFYCNKYYFLLQKFLFFLLVIYIHNYLLIYKKINVLFNRILFNFSTTKPVGTTCAIIRNNCKVNSSIIKNPFQITKIKKKEIYIYIYILD